MASFSRKMAKNNRNDYKMNKIVHVLLVIIMTHMPFNGSDGCEGESPDVSMEKNLGQL